MGRRAGVWSVPGTTLYNKEQRARAKEQSVKVKWKKYNGVKEANPALYYF